MILEPFESWEWALSNGSKIVKNGALHLKIWLNEVGSSKNKGPINGRQGPSKMANSRMFSKNGTY
jgi:hypothetical protein